MSKSQENTNGIHGTSASQEQASKASTVQLDVNRLHSLPSEQQNLYLLTFTLSLENHVCSLNHEETCLQQSQVTKELLQIVQLAAPVPTRVIRNSLGRCWSYMLSKGDRKPLYESINQLVAIISAGKNEKELHSRHAAVYCLGEVYKAAGDSAITLSSVTCSHLLRLFKTAQTHTGLRAAIFRALEKLVGSVQGSVDETIAKDIWKTARGAASGDKAALVQANACRCLEELVRSTSYFDSAVEFEALKTTIWKTCDSPIALARRAAASCLATILVKGYSDAAPSRSASKPKKSKKPAKNHATPFEDEDGDPSHPSSPAARKGVVKLELNLPDLLGQLSSHYVRSSTTNKARAAITYCYIRVLKRLDSSVVQASYGEIASHLFSELLGNATISYDRYRLLLTRKYVQKILADCLASQVLAESGRLNAAKTLVNNILKNYPQVVKEIPEPSKQTLVGALNSLAYLIESLGSVFGTIGDSCQDALIQVLQHPSYTVQIHAAYCLRAFVLACPQQLIHCASICMNNATRELNHLTSGRHSHRRCVGFANGLAAVLSVSPLQPLYGSLEISSRALSIANDLLKNSAKAELRASSTQVQVAWILIGGLMSMGPDFVKIHVPQLLLLWRNALPKPLTRENSVQRDLAELSYLTHVRECALGSVLSFLESNQRLVTLDVSIRIAGLLQNTVDFLDTLPAKVKDENPSSRIVPALHFSDLVVMLRRRVLQCYTRLINFGPISSTDALGESKLLSLAVTLFADPSYSPGSLESSIANSAASFDSIWDVADNRGFGVSGMVQGQTIKPLPGEGISPERVRSQDKTDDHVDIDDALVTPICGAREHDSVYIHIRNRSHVHEVPDPPATEVTNSAIALFAVVFPTQSPKVQEFALEQLMTLVSGGTLQRSPGRKAAVVINTALALLGATKVAVGEVSAEAGDLKHPAVEKALQALLRGFIIDPDRHLRHLGYEALGRLCNSSGNTFTTNEVNTLRDLIVSNRDPNARAGYAMALGSIHSNVGGMAAGLHLKKIHGVLMSLCSDPHPVVHFGAIEALAQVADSAGLAFSAYVSSTLGLLAQAWSFDTHNEECAALATSNSICEVPTPTAVARAIDSLINVVGPDLQDMSKVRELVVSLLTQFERDSSPDVRAEGLRCWEHMYLYDPGHVDLSSYVKRLQQDIQSSDRSICALATDGLYNLIRRDARLVFQLATEGFEEQIWLTLNDRPNLDGITTLIEAWLGQTSLTEAAVWIVRIQQVLTKSAATQKEEAPQSAKPVAEPDLQDEEVAGFATGETKEQGATAAPEPSQELLRWQVRVFALQCLSKLVAVIGKDLDLDSNSTAGHTLQTKVGDVIRMAFHASTSSVVELRVGGLKLINQILMIFGSTPDPDFSEALLLEQYQAQVSSALTPAFNADSSPELASAAVNVCATFIATGMVTDVERMGRILKLLVGALESLTASDSQEAAVGDLRGLSSNAQTMVRMAVLSAWAELQVARTEQRYLDKVVDPHVGKLLPLWLSSLQEFARLRFEPDISSHTGPPRPDESLETVYAALNRKTLLKFYQDSWLELVDAIASLIEQDPNFVFAALEGRSSTTQMNGDTPKTNIAYRDEPVAFFFVLFGIAVEALVTRSNHESPGDVLKILSALKKILSPAVAGNAIFQDAVFSETIEVFDRLALTEGLAVQTILVDIAKTLCLTHPSAVEEGDTSSDLNEDIEQLFELARVIVLILTNALPNIADSKLAPLEQLSDEAVSLIRNGFEALVEASGIFPSIIKTDLYASILHIFSVILSTPACQAAVVPQTLPGFRRFIQKLALDDGQSGSSPITPQIKTCMHRLLAILGIAQRREHESSLACAKNTLLTTSILLTTASSVIAADEPLVFAALEATLDCLQDLGLAKVAAGCLRSLLLTNPKSEIDEAIARYLFPRLVATVTTPAAAAAADPDSENAKTIIAQALTAFVALHANDEHKAAAAMAIVLPTLLYRAKVDGEAAYNDTATHRITELARGPLLPVFRGLVSGMDSEMRSFIEQVIREGGGGGGGGVGRSGRGDAGTGAEEGAEPTIALKFNFGG
ncbi:MAG: hypothetical protein L6R42_001258 [Xanthoria sp. 1 TBL-2021]|nr:MAG: hypothetical protein L6R42_001258 [Xanthoria sp. 1 TBL-2021]